MPRPRSSGATRTLDTPAIGSWRPPHHCRMSWKMAPPRRAPDEGTQAAARGDVPGHGLPPAFPFLCALDAEGPFGQVELRVDVVACLQDPDLEIGMMVSHEHSRYGSRLGRSSD